MSNNYLKATRQYEPDGCSTNSLAVQIHNKSLASAIINFNKISSNFDSLMNYKDGQCLFEQFAKINDIDDYVRFWFAIAGFKKQFNELDGKRKNETFHKKEILFMAKAIYNNFIKSNAKSEVYKWFTVSTREMIYNKISKNELDINIFDDVKKQFEIKLQEEIYPKFLKSEICQKYLENLKNNSDFKANKSKIINPYHQSSYSNFHPTSTQESEVLFNMKEDEPIMANERKEKKNKENETKSILSIKSDKTLINLQLNDNLEKSSKNNQLTNQQDKSTKKRSNKNQTQFERMVFDQDRTLQLLCSKGAQSEPSCLPCKPCSQEDIKKINNFISQLEKLREARLNQENKECDQRVSNNNKKLDSNGKSSSKKLIKRDSIKSEDSRSIVEKHCLRAFSSNSNSRGLNSPAGQIVNSTGLNSPKKILKSNTQIENRQNLLKKSNQDHLNFNQTLIHSFNEPKNCNQFNSINLSNNLTSRSNADFDGFITIMYQYSDDIPYSIRTNKSAITLRKFKQEITKKQLSVNQKYRFFFKKKDQLLNIYLMQELTNDDDYVPFFEHNKVWAKIEIEPINK